MLTVDDYIRIVFQDFDLDYIFRETKEEKARKLAQEATKGMEKDLRRALKKALKSS